MSIFRCLMLTKGYTQRFAGIARVYGESALRRFFAAHVCVVGLGGVGSWAVEALARSGIGTLTLIDLDEVCISNTNRQLQALNHHTGQFKSELLGTRMLQINPEIKLHINTDYLTPANLTDLIKPEMTYVFDCIDSVQSKAALIAYCKRHKIKLVTTGGAGGQIDPQQIQMRDLNKTHQDPLAKKVRSVLRRNYGFSRNAKRNYGIPCVTSSEALRYPQADGSVSQYKAPQTEAVKLDCSSGFGASTMVTASFAFVGVAGILAKIAQAPTQ